MRKYKYIRVPEDRKCDPADILTTDYTTIESLKGLYIVRNAVEYTFTVYAKPEDIPLPGPLHEVIFGTLPQKLKFDIDIKPEEVKEFIILTKNAGMDMPIEHADIAETVYEEILTCIKDTFLTSYGILLDDIIKCTSHGAGVFSYHIIIPKYCVLNNKEAMEFTKRVTAILPRIYRRFLDVSINKSLQNFRLLGAVKTDGSRKKITDDNISFVDTLITYTDDCKPLPQLLGAEPTATTPIENVHPEELQRILEICKQYAVGHEYKENRAGLLRYKRVCSSFCDLCNRNHDKDSTFMATVSRYAGKIYVYRRCGHDSTKQSILIGEFQTGETIETMAIEGGYMQRIIQRSSEYKAHTLFDLLPKTQTLVYDESTLRPFELHPTLCVRANMKMGKTKALLNYLSSYFPANELRDPIVRIISFRQTFSANIKERFEGFTLYSDVKGPLIQNKLIVQVESLYRICIQPGTEVPDLIVLDEIESILEQFDSGLLKNFSGSFAVFQWLMKYSKHIICMDANISDRTYRTVQRMRPAHQIYYHNNTHKNATADTYNLTGEKLSWLLLLHDAVRNGEKVAVCMSSLSEAKVIQESFIRKYPDKNIKLYSSETQVSEKREHFGNVNHYWGQLDILMYTPAASAGISFEQKRFSKMFGYFTDRSCPVDTCLQMMGRVRDISSHNYYIYLSGISKDLPTDPLEIKNYLYDNRQGLFSGIGQNYLQFEYTEEGIARYVENDYFNLWLENTRHRNLSANAFVKRFINMVSTTGAQLRVISEDDLQKCIGNDEDLANVLDSLGQENTGISKEIIANINKSIADARDITDEEAYEIQSNISGQQDVTPEQRCESEKYRLRQDYGFTGQITPKFVGRYRATAVRRVYKNLRRLHNNCEVLDIRKSLHRIQQDDKIAHQYALESGVNDLSRRYVFNQHRIALGLLVSCGFNDIYDKKTLSDVSIHQSLMSAETSVMTTIPPACNEFKLKQPNLGAIIQSRNDPSTYVTLMVKFINKILVIMYGARIIENRSIKGMYSLQTCELFDIRDRDSARPAILPREIQPATMPIDQPVTPQDIFDI